MNDSRIFPISYSIPDMSVSISMYKHVPNLHHQLESLKHDIVLELAPHRSRPSMPTLMAELTRVNVPAGEGDQRAPIVENSTFTTSAR